MLLEDELTAIIGDIYVGAFDAVRAATKDEWMTRTALIEIGTRLAGLGADTLLPRQALGVGRTGGEAAVAKAPRWRKIKPPGLWTLGGTEL